ncbi:MAG TPA: hypothetical protein VF599_08250 [Pyrinomonadaceae bacterium]|jgi:hypothetical protein
MKFLVVSLLFILLLILPCSAQNKPDKPRDFTDGLLPFPRIVFLIPESIQDGWVTVEFENPKCKRLMFKDAVLELKIPNSGYLCSSNRLPIGLPDEEFYIVDKKRKRNAVKIREAIFEPQIEFIKEQNKETLVFKFFVRTRNRQN